MVSASYHPSGAVPLLGMLVQQLLQLAWFGLGFGFGLGLGLG